jgi:hypothetical protein
MRDVIICHCSMCRIQGAIASVGVLRVNFRILRGQDVLKGYRSSPKATRWFCGDCGSAVYWDPAAPRDYVAVWAGGIDQPTGLRTAGHIFVAEKPDYYDLEGNNLPVFDGPEHNTSLQNPDFLADLS